MSKYSTEAYSIEMGKAVDMWAESAVFLVTLMELIKISKKLMTGMLLDSMTEQNLLTRIHSKVPAILSSSAFSLIPPVFDYESDDALAAPLSSIAIYRTVKQIVQQAFRKKSFTNEGLTQEDCVEVMEDIIKLVIERLQHSISTIHEELDDVVPFGNKNCKEWLHIQKNKLFPMQK